MFDVDTLNRANALGKDKDFRLAKGRSREPAPILLPNHGRIEALLNRGPDAKARRKNLVAVVVHDDEVRPIACTEFVNAAEQVVDGIAGKNVRQTGLNAHAHERQASGVFPLTVGRKLRIAQLDVSFLVWCRGVGLGERHGHIEVIGGGGERTLKNGGHKLWLHRIHHVRCSVTPSHLGHAVCARRVNGIGHKSIRNHIAVLRADPRDGAFRACRIVVGHNRDLPERATSKNLCHSVAHATGSHDKNAHSSTLLRTPLARDKFLTK